VTENFEKAFEIANLMSTVCNQKLSLLEEFEQSILFFYNGGCFKADQSLISFLTSLKDMNQESVVLLDVNKMPIRIENLEKFRQDVVSCYFEASNKYLSKYQSIQQNKNIKSILEL
jgi:hypothetical protein